MASGLVILKKEALVQLWQEGLLGVVQGERRAERVVDETFQAALGVRWRVPSVIYLIFLAGRDRAGDGGAPAWDFVGVSPSGRGQVRHGKPDGELQGVPFYSLEQGLVVASLHGRSFWGTKDAVSTVVRQAKQLQKKVKPLRFWDPLNRCLKSREEGALAWGCLDLRRRRGLSKKSGGDGGQISKTGPFAALWRLNELCLHLDERGSLHLLMSGEAASTREVAAKLKATLGTMQKHLQRLKDRRHQGAPEASVIDGALRSVQSVKLKLDEEKGRLEIEIPWVGRLLRLLF